MQAIETKYIGPTNTRGSRIKASAQAGSVTVSWDYSANVERSHDAGAEALIIKLGWFGVWVPGGLVKGTGNAYVCVARAQTPQQVRHCKRIAKTLAGAGAAHLVVLEK